MIPLWGIDDDSHAFLMCVVQSIHSIGSIVDVMLILFMCVVKRMLLLKLESGGIMA
jgi:hypothetical protein